ncbi:MAG: hypothetical protein MJ252_00660 [archaeon]|nr:hypothetical protein [archaeon]
MERKPEQKEISDTDTRFNSKLSLRKKRQETDNTYRIKSLTVNYLYGGFKLGVNLEEVLPNVPQDVINQFNQDPYNYLINFFENINPQINPEIIKFCLKHLSLKLDEEIKKKNNDEEISMMMNQSFVNISNKMIWLLNNSGLDQQIYYETIMILVDFTFYSQMISCQIVNTNELLTQLSSLLNTWANNFQLLKGVLYIFRNLLSWDNCYLKVLNETPIIGFIFNALENTRGVSYPLYYIDSVFSVYANMINKQIVETHRNGIEKAFKKFIDFTASNFDQGLFIEANKCIVKTLTNLPENYDFDELPMSRIVLNCNQFIKIYTTEDCIIRILKTLNYVTYYSNKTIDRAIMDEGVCDNLNTFVLNLIENKTISPAGMETIIDNFLCFILNISDFMNSEIEENYIKWYIAGKTNIINALIGLNCVGKISPDNKETLCKIIHHLLLGRETIAYRFIGKYNLIQRFLCPELQSVNNTPKCMHTLLKILSDIITKGYSILQGNERNLFLPLLIKNGLGEILLRMANAQVQGAESIQVSEYANYLYELYFKQ